MKLNVSHNRNVRFVLVLLLLLTFSFESLSQDTIIVDTHRTPKIGLDKLMQGKTPGLEIKSWTGTPGHQFLMSLRSIEIDGYESFSNPVILVNGLPIVSNPSSITHLNPLANFSADHIERIEVIKDADELAKLGVIAPNGAINLITKSGVDGKIRITANISGGINQLSLGEKFDEFYGFSPKIRKEVYGQTFIHDEGIMLDGGGDFGSYLVGFNNHGDAGSIKGIKLKRQAIFFVQKRVHQNWF